MSIQFFFDNLWRWKCGLPEEEEIRMPSLEEMQRTQWLPAFEKAQRERLIMGAFRYGLNFTGNQNKSNYDRISSIIKRAELYKETGNDELLVDIANFAMLEFGEGIHPNKHFKTSAQTDKTERK